MPAGRARSRTGFTGPRAARLLACADSASRRARGRRVGRRGRRCTASGPAAAAGASCPGVVNASGFTSKAQLRRMTAKFNSFGPRIMGSTAHNKAIEWLEGRPARSGSASARDPSSPTAGSLAPASSADPVSTSARRAGSASPDSGGSKRERARRRGGSLVQADREERRGRPARLPRAGSGDHRRERGGQGGRSRLPDRFASFRRGGSAAGPLPDARPRRLHGVHPAVPRDAP